MRNKRSRAALVGVLSLALSVTAGLMVGGVADAAKKKTSKPKILRATGTPGAVPNGPTSNLVNPVPFKGTARIGGKGKGKVIGDIDVTLSASAVAAAGSTDALGDLSVRITAPNGATTGLVFGGGGFGGPFAVSGSLISNLTLSDETPTVTCAAGSPGPAPPPPPPPPCGDPDATLLSPYTGTAQPAGLLDILNESRAKGTYTLTAFDRSGDPAIDSGTATITGWSIKVKAVSPRV